MEFKKILVPVSGASPDEETVKLACQIAKKSKAQIYVVYIIMVKRSLPLDAEIETDARTAERVLTRAEDIAAERDYMVETDLIQARDVGPAVVDEATVRDVDLILMGVGYKKRFGIFTLGTAVPYVLEHASCPVLIYREPVMKGDRWK